SEITEAQRAYHLRKMRTRMLRVDVIGDGYLTREDYEEMGIRMAEISKMTEQQAKKTRKEFLRVADQMGIKSGVKISVEEAAVKASDSLLAMTPEEKVKSVTECAIMYDVIDTDNDGYISLPEFKAFLQVLGPDITDEKAIECFNSLDFNGNGQISRDEFLLSSHEFLHGLEESPISNAFFGDLVD
uniref:EF-hand domain-containing protein n=1 Tax=Salmonella sp. s51933 TaxID=3160127 RepID=UPI0037550875